MAKHYASRPLGSLSGRGAQHIIRALLFVITHYLSVDALLTCGKSLIRSFAWWLIHSLRRLPKKRGFKIFQNFLYIYTFAHIAIGGFHTVNAVNQLKPINNHLVNVSGDTPTITHNAEIIQFSFEGKASVSMGNAYVQTVFPLQDAICSVKQFEHHVSHMTKSDQHFFFYNDSLHHDFKPIIKDMDAIMSSVGAQAISCDFHQERQKRGLLATMGGLTLFGGMALTQVQMHQLRHSIHDLKKHVNTIVRTIGEQHTLIGRNTESLRQLYNLTTEQFGTHQIQIALNKAADKAREVRDNTRAVVNMLKMGHLDSTLVHNGPLKAQLDEINAVANKHRLTVPNLSTAAVHSYPTSYDFNDTHLLIYTKIPLLSQKFELDIYKFNQQPFHTEDGWHQFVTSRPYLAVGKRPATVFSTFSEAEFNRCRIVAGYWVCKQSPQLKKNQANLEGKDDDRCLYALWAKDSEATRVFCTLTRAESVLRTVSLGYNTFILYTPDPVNVVFDCPGKKTVNERVNHTATFFLPAGCYAETPATFDWGMMDISSSTPEMAHIIPETSIVDKLQALGANQIAAMRTAGLPLDHHIEKTAKMHKQQQEIIRQQENLWNQFYEHPPSVISMALGAIAVLLFFAGLAWYCHRQMPKLRQWLLNKLTDTPAELSKENLSAPQPSDAQQQAAAIGQHNFAAAYNAHNPTRVSLYPDANAPASNA